MAEDRNPPVTHCSVTAAATGKVYYELQQVNVGNKIENLDRQKLTEQIGQDWPTKTSS
jgi:hypothetical protein